MFTRIKNYLIEARHELRNVQWPTRAEAIKLTSVVVGVSLGLAVFLGVFDTLFSYLLKIFVIKA
jgi:preprotein translocase subunit SecE